MSSSTPSRTNIAAKKSTTSLRLIRPFPVVSSTANEKQSTVTSSLPYESSPSTNTTPDSNSENKNQYDDNNSNLASTEFTSTKAPSGQKKRQQDKSVSSKRTNASNTMNSNNDDILEEVIVDFDHQLTKIAASVSPIRSRPGLVVAGVTRGVNNTNKLTNKAGTILSTTTTGSVAKVEEQTDDKKTSATANAGANKTIAASSRSVFGNRYHRSHHGSSAGSSTSASAVCEDKESESTATLNDEIATAAANTACSIIDELRNPSNNDNSKGRKLTSRSAATTPHRRRNTSLSKPTSAATVAVASATPLVPSSLEASGTAVSSTSSTSSTTSSTALRPSYRLAASLLSSTFADPSADTADQVPAKTETASSKPNSITTPGTTGIRRGKASYTQTSKSLVLSSSSSATARNDEANFIEEKKDEDRNDINAASTKTPTTLASIATPSSSVLASTTLRYSRYARNIKKKTSTATTSKQTSIAANSPSSEISSIPPPAPERPTSSTSEPTTIDVITKTESDFVATNDTTNSIDERFCEINTCNNVGTNEALTSPAPSYEPKVFALAESENVETVVNIAILTETTDETELKSHVSQKMVSPHLGGGRVELDEVITKSLGTAVTPVERNKEQNTHEKIDEGSIRMNTGTLVNNANTSKCTDEDDVYVPPSRSRFDIVAASNESWLKQSQLKKRAIEESSSSKSHTETVPSNKDTIGSSSATKAAKAALESKLGNSYVEVSKDVNKSLQAAQPVNEMISTRFSNKESNAMKGATGRFNGVSEYDGNRLLSPETGAIQLNGRIGVDDGLIRQSAGKSNELVVASWRNRLKSSNGHDEGFQSDSVNRASVECKVDSVCDDESKKNATSKSDLIKNKVTMPNDDDQTDRSVGNVLAVWRTRIGSGSDDISNGPRSLSKSTISSSTAAKSPNIVVASADLKVAQIGTSFVQNHRNSTSNSPVAEAARYNSADVPKFGLRQTASDTGDQINLTDKRTMKVKQLESTFLSRPINKVNNDTVDQVNLASNRDMQQIPPLADAEDHFSQRVSESGSHLTEQLSGDTECVSVASRRQIFLQRLNGGIAAGSSHSTTGSTKKSGLMKARSQQEASQEIVQNINVVSSSRSVADSSRSGPSLVKGAATGNAMHNAKKGIAQKWRQWEEANLNGTPGTRFNEEVNQSSGLTQHREETRDIPNTDSYASSYTSINSFGPIDEIPSEISPQSSGDYCNRPSQFKMSTSSSLGSNDHIVHKKPVTTENSLITASNVNKSELKNQEQHKNNLTANQRQVLQKDNSIAVCSVEAIHVITGSDTSVSARKAQLWAPNGGLIVNFSSTRNDTTVDDESTSDGAEHTEPMDEMNKQRSQESGSVEKVPSNDTTESGSSLDFEGFNTSLCVIPNRADVSTPIGMSPPQRGDKIEAVPKSTASLEGQDSGCKETVKSRFNINETALFPSVGNKLALPRKVKANDNDISSSSGHSQGNSKRNQERKSMKDSILSWMSDSFRTSSRRLTNKDENDVVIASNEVSTNPEGGVEISQPLLAAYDDTPQNNSGILISQTTVTEDLFVPARPPKHNGGGQYGLQLSQTESQPNIERAHEPFGNINVPLHRSVSLGDFQENISPEKNGLSSDNGNLVGEANNIQILTDTSSGIHDGFPTVEGPIQTSLRNMDEEGFVSVNASSTPNIQSSWNALVRKEDRPWNKDQRTLSPESWQKKKGIDFEAALLSQSGHSHNINGRIDTSSRNAVGVPLSAEGEQFNVTTTGSSVATTKETAPTNMESLRGSESPYSATSSTFGNPEAFGPTVDEGESFPSLPVSQKATALAKWNDGLGVPSRPIEKQDIVGKGIGRSLSPIARDVTLGNLGTNATNHRTLNNGENHVTRGISISDKQIPEERHWNSGDADFGIPDDYEIFDVQPLSSSLKSKENEAVLNDDKLHGWSTEDIPDFPSNNNVSLVKHAKEADIFDPFSSMDDDDFLPRTQAIPDVERHISTPVEIQLSNRSQNLQNNDDGRYTAKSNLDGVSSIAVVRDLKPESFTANDPFSPESVSSFMVPRVELASLKKNLSVFDPFSSDEAYENGNDVLFEDDPDMFTELSTVYPKQQQDTSVSNEFFSDDFFVPQNYSRKEAKSGYEADQSCLHESNFEI